MFFKPKPQDGANVHQRGSGPRLTREDKMKMYEVLLYKVFQKGDNLCQYGEMGDRFFIILEGMVGIRVPLNIERGENSTWDIFKFVLKQYKNIRQFKDHATKEVALLIKIIGRSLLKRLNFTRVVTLIDFLTKCEKQAPDFMAEHPELQGHRLTQDVRKIKVFRYRLMAEIDRIEDHVGGSVSKE